MEKSTKIWDFKSGRPYVQYTKWYFGCICPKHWLPQEPCTEHTLIQYWYFQHIKDEEQKLRKYLDWSQISLYLLYSSEESSSLQYPILLITINSLWCGSTTLPGISDNDSVHGSEEYPFCKCWLSLFDLFWASSLAICSKWPD